MLLQEGKHNAGSSQSTYNFTLKFYFLVKIIISVFLEVNVYCNSWVITCQEGSNYMLGIKLEARELKQ